VSSNLPQFSHMSSPSGVPADFPYAVAGKPAPVRREWFIACALFCATLLTTSLAGLFYYFGVLDFSVLWRALLNNPRLIAYGLTFSIPLLLILLAHELGHFFACKYYGMQCTPPFFIPAPFPITGTFGAFIKIRSHFKNRRALFDIGVAGPIAGFAVALPTLWIGISLSKVIPKGMTEPGGLGFGEPILLRVLGALILGYSPEKQDMLAHPLTMAAWVGLLATSLNLLPAWQFDGGHIAYAIFGRSLHRRLSIISVAFLVLLGFWSWPTPSYLVMAILLLIIGGRWRFYHPPTISDEEELGSGRLVVGLIALLILIACFIPVPVTLT
jgi:membrane-associated protease RseP (regulator of RpoE activity)